MPSYLSPGVYVESPRRRPSIQGVGARCDFVGFRHGGTCANPPCLSPIGGRVRRHVQDMAEEFALGKSVQLIAGVVCAPTSCDSPSP